MKKFENIDQEKYDQLKIFLVSNFNLIFLDRKDSSVAESFEITVSGDKIVGNYHKNKMLSLNTKNDSNAEYQKIIKKINETVVNSQKKESQSESTVESDQHAEDLLIKEYATNSKKFYEHILECKTCRAKLYEIWKHLYGNN